VFVVHHQLGHGASLDLCLTSLASAGRPGFAIVQGGGRGCVLKVDAPVAGIWIPLRGRLQLGGSTSDLLAHPGEVRVTETEPRLRAVGRGSAVWIAVLGTAPAWRQMLGALLGPSADPMLLPASHPAGRDLRRGAVALARAAASGAAENALDAFLDRIVALQSQFADAIARCPGRTYAQRRQVFLRLQRVRNYLAANCHLDVDNDELARMASYSPWHFIRAFRAAYEETPHAYLVRMRLEHARRLLQASPLAIAEIALASGFENRCAFSRLFRQRFGTTAGAMRKASRAMTPPLPMRA
jgi:AraC family transcriptional regulator